MRDFLLPLNLFKLGFDSSASQTPHREKVCCSNVFSWIFACILCKIWFNHTPIYLHYSVRY